MSLAGVGGLGLVAWGTFDHFYHGPGLTSAAALAAGLALVVAALLQSTGRKTERLRADRWTRRDSVVLGAAALSLVLVGALRFTGAGEADYLAYPEVAAPAFHPAGALAFVALLVPALVNALDGAQMESIE